MDNFKCPLCSNGDLQSTCEVEIEIGLSCGDVLSGYTDAEGFRCRKCGAEFWIDGETLLKHREKHKEY